MDAPEPAGNEVASASAAAPPAGDAALHDHNLRLSAQSQQGATWLIGGRVGGGVAGATLLVGVTVLSIYAADVSAYNSDDLEPPPTGGRLAAGLAITGVGLVGVGVSIFAAVRGARLTRAARAGQLVLRGSPRHAFVGYRARF